MRMNELLKFITKNQAMFYSTNPRSNDVDADCAVAAIVEPSYKFEEEVLNEMKRTDFNLHFATLAADMNSNSIHTAAEAKHLVKCNKPLRGTMKGTSKQQLQSVGVGTKSKRGTR